MIFKRWIQWIQRLYSCLRQEDPKEQDDEQKKQGQQGQPKDKGGQGEQSRMLVTLHELQRTMDPLIAAQVYNNNHSPLGRLPEELLLCILRCIGDDVLTLYCLRRISRIFRRLIYELEIWKQMLPPPSSQRFGYSTEACWRLPIHLYHQLRQRLQSDGLCNDCKLWCDVPVKGWFNWFIQTTNLKSDRFLKIQAICKFDSLQGYALYCDVCGINHDMRRFSPSNQQPDKRNRQCLGREGAVQLCKHVHISWAAVEEHITDWQQRKPGDWQACWHFVAFIPYKSFTRDGVF